MEEQFNGGETAPDIEDLKSKRWKLGAGAAALYVGYAVSLFESGGIHLLPEPVPVQTSGEAIASIVFFAGAALTTMAFNDTHDEIRKIEQQNED